MSASCFQPVFARRCSRSIGRRVRLTGLLPGARSQSAGSETSKRGVGNAAVLPQHCDRSPARARQQEPLRARQVVGVDQVHPVGQHFGPEDGLVRRAPERTRRPCWWALATMAWSLRLSVAGMAPEPRHLKLCPQELLIQGMRLAGSPESRSARSPSIEA